MTHIELFRVYLRHYADKNLEAISAMLAEDVHAGHFLPKVPRKLYGKGIYTTAGINNQNPFPQLNIGFLKKVMGLKHGSWNGNSFPLSQVRWLRARVPWASSGFSVRVTYPV